MHGVATDQVRSTGTWTPMRRAALAGLVLLIFLVAFETIAVATAMPTVARELHGLDVYPVAFAVPYAASVLAMVAAGTWSDARGPRQVLLVGIVMFVAGLLVAAAASGMATVVLGRTVQSMGGGLVSVSAYALIARIFPPELRPKVFVGMSMAWVAPSLFGPPLAGYLATEVTWRWVFGGAALLSVPALLLLAPVLRRLRIVVRPVASRQALRRQLVAGSAAAGGAALLSAGSGRPPAVAAGLAAAGLLLVAVAVPRLLPAGTVGAAPGIPAIVVTRGLLMAAFAGADVYLPLMLMLQHGLSPTAAGLVLSVGATSWALGAWVAGRLVTDDARRRVVRIGLGLLGVAVLGCLVGALPQVPGWVVYPSWLLGGSGIGMAYSSLTVLLMGASGEREQGRNASALQVGETLTTSLLLGLSAWVFAALRPVSATAGFTTGLALALLCALLGLATSGRLRVAGSLTR